MKYVKNQKYIWKNLEKIIYYKYIMDLNLGINYCKKNYFILIQSSPYQSQSNEVVELVHKEIIKYIYNEFFY